MVVQMALGDEVAEAFACLLELWAAEVTVERPLVLTAAPGLWNVRPGMRLVSLDVLRELPDLMGQEKPAAGTVARPASMDELEDTIQRERPDAIIIDPSIFLSCIYNQWKGKSHRRMPWTFDLVERVPAEFRPAEDKNVDVMNALLAWVAGIESLRGLNAVVPRPIVQHPDHAALRRYVSGRLRPSAILDLPSGLFPHMRWLPASLLFCGGERSQVHVDAVPGPDAFTAVTTRPWFERLQVWLQYGESLPACLVPQAGAGDVWSRSPEVDPAETAERLGHLGEVEPLGTLCDVQTGASGIKVSEASSQDGIPLIGRSALSRGSLDLDALPKVTVEAVPDRAFLRAGDILLAQTVTDSSLAILNRSSTLAIFSDGVIAIRPRDERVSPEYLVEYLNSTTGRALIAACTTDDAYFGVPRVKITALRQLPVPLLDPALFQGMTHLQETEEALRAHADTLRQHRRLLFAAPDERSFRQQLNELKRRGHLFEQGIDKVDSPAYQIANFYPFPLAFGYRSLERWSEMGKRYREQLRVAENLLAFLGSLALALLPADQRAEAEIDARDFWRGGISPGDWRDIVRRCGKVFARHDPGTPARALADLQIEVERKGFGADIAALIRAKNDYKHDRASLSGVEGERAVAQVQEALDRCMERLAFLTDFPLRHLRDFSPDRRGRWTLEYVACTGDHPALPQGCATYPSALPMGRPIKEELYVVADQASWVSLYPFMSVQECPSCRTTEMYFIDRWNERTGRATLKSYERGHTVEDVEIAQELTIWQDGDS